jgi:hypothetical protein
MDQPKTKLCPYCGVDLFAGATECASCGRSLVRGETVLQAHVARTAAKQKRAASKLFWLGLVITFIGCFQATSSDIDLAGNLIETSVRALITAFMVYLVGLIAAAVNSFTPPFLGENIGMVSRILILAGGAVLIFACRSFALARGRSESFGYLGVFGILGVIVLAVLPDRRKKQAFV